MMFDPPDYPFKDLSDSLREYGTDDTLFSVDEMKCDYQNKSYQQNNSGRYFNVQDPVTGINITHKDTNTDLLVIQTDNLLNFEPTLLDENTVNQFLLIPPENGSQEKKKDEVSGPDLLALQSCVLCHEIFTTDADLLDHTISVHSIDSTIDQAQDYLESLHTCSGENLVTVEENSIMPISSNSIDLDTDWLVCCMCQRILSTALEVGPKDQMCCLDENSKSRVTNRKLNTMYVCEYCSGLYADGQSLDRHRSTCNIQTDTYYFTEETNELVLEDRHVDNIFLTPEISEPTSGTLCDLKSNSDRKVSLSNNGKHLYASNSSSSKMWNCGSCNQLFATARELYRHKRGEDRPEGAPLTAYVCDECDKVLGSMCALHTHRKMHKVTKPGYPCKICGRRFNQSGHLAIHMRMHTGERPYPCDLCSKAFKVKVERDDHRRTHTGERPFACTACPKTFTAAARLREHARIHTDQRPYRCEICGAAFRRPYARTVHTLIHTGEKPHECDICGTAFSIHAKCEDCCEVGSDRWLARSCGKNILMK